MKRTVQFSFLFFAFLMFLPCMASAQEEKMNTVTITITEDGKVTTDTTFEIAEGQDPDMVKMMVEELAGGEIHIKSGKHAHKQIMYMKGDDDEDTWHIYDVDIDSIKEAHGGAHVMVMKSDHGDFDVKVISEDDEDFEFETEEGKTYKVKVVKEGDCDVEGGKHKKVIIKEYRGEGGEGEKRIKVFVSEDDEVKVIDEDGELEWIEEDEEKVVKKKKVKVEIHEDDEEENKEVKKKKKKKEK